MPIASPRFLATAAAVVVQLVVALFLVVTWPEIPDPGRLAPDQARNGFIAVLERGTPDCLAVVDAATARRRQLTCDDAAGFAGWSSAGRILVVPESGDRRAIDPLTGDATATDLDRPLVGIPPTTVSADAEQGRVRLVVDDVTVWSERVPGDYRLGRAQPSPDGRYVLVIDSEHRLLLGDSRRPGGVAVVATDVVRAAWFTPGRFPAAVVEAPGTAAR